MAGTLIPMTARDAIGQALREIPHDGRAPVVTHDDRLLFAVMVDERGDVVREVDHVVVLDRRRARRTAEAALIGRDRVVAGRRERRNLVTPRVRELGKAVAQDHERTGARLGDRELDAVHGDGASRLHLATIGAHRSASSDGNRSAWTIDRCRVGRVSAT